MSHSLYKKPPITEAVIEIRFSSKVDPSAFKKLIARFKKYYPELKPIESHEVKVDLKSRGVEDVVMTDYRLSSHDMTQIVILKQSSFLFSQLAPYESWDAYISRFERDWSLFEKSAGYNEIGRIGVRFINRIDIPESESSLEKYVRIYPNIPDKLKPVVNYSIQSQTILNSINSVLKINSAVVSSPLPKHVSIVIDQDISRLNEIPQRAEDILGFLNQVRIEKNAIFESCITDSARELFNL